MKFNVIIPVRGREEYLKLCLQSLKRAAEGKDVKIYMATDSLTYNLVDFVVPKSINSIIHDNRPPKEGEEYPYPFNKSKLINDALRVMRKDFDFVSIVDADMVYAPDFFDIISMVQYRDKYIISGGYKLNQGGTCEVFFKNLTYSKVPTDFIDEIFKFENDNQLYPSQITLSYNLYNKLLSILQTKGLYHEDFVGWGGEDSYLSFFSRECEKKGIIRKVYLRHMWYHLYHEPIIKSKDFDKGQHNKNVKLLYQLNEINRTKIEEYLSIHDKQTNQRM